MRCFSVSLSKNSMAIKVCPCWLSISWIAASFLYGTSV